MSCRASTSRSHGLTRLSSGRSRPLSSHARDFAVKSPNQAHPVEETSNKAAATPINTLECLRVSRKNWLRISSPLFYLEYSSRVFGNERVIEITSAIHAIHSKIKSKTYFFRR